jgi:hypothetical protein
MDLGIVVMITIIGITILVIGLVMFYGLKHDPHMDVRSPESSRSVQLLQAQNVAAMKKLEAMQTQAQLATETATDKPLAGASALGSDEEKAARKAAALARKAAKQQQVAE